MPESQLNPKLPLAESFASEYLDYYKILPLEITAGRLLVATVGTPASEALDELADSYQTQIELVPVGAEEFRDALRRAFAASESVVELVRDLTDTLDTGALAADSLTDVRDLANQPPVIRFVNLLIREAHDATASDIHLEATDKGLRVRLRIDGVLTELPAPPVGLQAAVISRIKLLAELDIAERRAPQDGRIRVRLEARELDLRISTVPTLYGESVVLRLLDRGGAPVTLDALGLAPEAFAGFRRLAERTHGIVLATGPTGSGKTTTLYAALGLRHPSREKIVTVEDPVEYHLPGVTQVPVHSRAGVSFSAALRSILRQDPDVLMVGEMRDRETASVAIQAAMTGHLVFSTLHTNGALAALSRLLDLGVEPYLLAATLEGVLAQRLVRRICPDCRVTYRPDPSSIALLRGQLVPDILPAEGYQRGAGCSACRQTGFRGRTGIFELLVITEEIRHELAHSPGSASIGRQARAQGMVTLKEDGWQKVRAGITTVEEVLRVAGA